MATTKSKSLSPQERESRVQERLKRSEGIPPPPDPPLSSGDLLEVARVIRDETRAFISHQVKSLGETVDSRLRGVDSRLQGFDRELAISLSKSLREETSQEISRMVKSLEVTYSSHFESLKKWYEDRLGEMEKSYTHRMGELEQSYVHRVQGLETAYSNGLGLVQELLKSLPTPQVSVTLPENCIEIKQLPSQVVLPEGAIRVDVNQSTPQVNVSIPEKSLSVEVHQLPSIVNVGEKCFQLHLDQAAPQVNFSVPENAFHLEVPRRGLVRKSITYDDMGRPCQVLEEEDTKCL